MTKTLRNRTLALAGVYQAAYLVNQIATRGMADSAALEASINSIFKIEASSVEAVFGDAGGVITGLSVLKKQLSERQTDGLQVTKYVVALLHLERKLMRQRDMLERIRAGIASAQQQCEHFHPTHENVLANLADIYKNTISTMTPRILVQGEHGHLTNPDNANKVRAILFAGIRSAVLWSQCGGSRWQILFKRAALLREAEMLLKDMRH
jgi:high frequency lysogenization protein